MSTDRIEKKIVLRAPLDRVWRALTDSAEFGVWFGVKFTNPFVAGLKIVGSVTPTKVNPDVAKAQKKYEGLPFEIVIDRIEPQTLFSFHWHPFAIEPGVDYSAEPMTLVKFELESVADGVQLTVSETGFDGIPIERRVKAFTANEGGWNAVTGMLAKYLGDAA